MRSGRGLDVGPCGSGAPSKEVQSKSRSGACALLVRAAVRHRHCAEDRKGRRACLWAERSGLAPPSSLQSVHWAHAGWWHTGAAPALGASPQSMHRHCRKAVVVEAMHCMSVCVRRAAPADSVCHGRPAASPRALPPV